MNLGQLIGELRLQAALGPSPEPEIPTLGGAPMLRPYRTGVTAKIRAVLAEATEPLTCKEIAARAEGITANQVATNIQKLRGIERSGEAGSYRYRAAP